MKADGGRQQTAKSRLCCINDNSNQIGTGSGSALVINDVVGYVHPRLRSSLTQQGG